MCSSLSVACGFVFGDPYSPLQFAVKNLQQERLELEVFDRHSLQPFYQTYIRLEQAPKIGHPLPAAPQLVEFPLQWDIFLCYSISQYSFCACASSAEAKLWLPCSAAVQPW